MYLDSLFQLQRLLANTYLHRSALAPEGPLLRRPTDELQPPEDQEDARIGQPSTQPWKRVCKGPQEPHTGTAAVNPGLGTTLHIFTMKNT